METLKSVIEALEELSKNTYEAYYLKYDGERGVSIWKENMSIA